MSFILRCIDCGHKAPYFPTAINCPQCNSQWREAEYDLATLSKTLPLQLPDRPFDLWRYHELLPVRNPDPSITLGEGGSPLIKATNLGLMLGCPNIFIKDERQGPTASFKDRQAAVSIAALKEAGITEMVVASTGNVAIAYSAYAARAGIKLWAFVTSLVPAVKMREIALYGSQVIKVTGSYDNVKRAASEFAQQRNLYQNMGARSIPSVESMKTIAYEISEQITAFLGADAIENNKSLWRTPDWYVQAISGGMGPLGVAKGFSELKEMGFINKEPAIAAIQTAGCSPMVTSWKKGLETAEIVEEPRTHIETLATGDPGRTYNLLRKAIDNTDGAFESVTDEEAFRAMHVIAKMEGVSAEPAAAVAFAGLFKLIRAGVIKPDDTVVVNCTGHTMPPEKFVLGDDWARNIVFPENETEKETPKEGILAALSHVVPERFSRVVIVDDTTEARLLIRRILQSQGDFTLFEAKNGKEALRIIRRENPDLIILDLMMPELDGFGVLDELKANAETENIPVIVSTAKELTKAERERLKGQIQSLLQKGDFMSDEFLDEVHTVIN
ncbi:MAG: pyridoxal-phosphate dependent enzyme [Chloroflexi bacterium]|nr:pyridoxal-phosphate dependent enzyme [Chloroflexota bacterium]